MEKQFEVLIKEYELLIYKVCRMFGKSDDDRQDLFQDILIQLWKGYPKFRGESKFSTWLYRIALNTAIAQYRKMKRAPPVIDLEMLPFDISNDTVDLQREAQYQEMYEAIKQLNDIEKAIVMLYLDDKTYDEMEDIMGISNGSLRVKMTRIKEKLRTITITKKLNYYGT